MKAMKQKNITIDDLAMMVQRGFEETAKKEDVNKRFDEAKEDVNKRFDRAFELFATKDELKELTDRINKLDESVSALTNAVDRLAKAVDDLRVEYSAIAMQVSRHEKWFQQVADKLGIKLEY